MKYTVDPGLYALGSPAADAPVCVTANYKMSFDHLRRALAGRDAWILVLDTKGNRLGQTPLKHEVERSDEELVLIIKRKGYKPQMLRIKPDRDHKQRVQLRRRFTGHIPDDPKGWR